MLYLFCIPFTITSHITTLNSTNYLGLHGLLKTLKPNNHDLQRSSSNWAMIAFFYVPKQEKGGGKACSFRGTAWVSCWGPAWSGQGTVELFISLPGLVLFISTILQVYTFTLGWINYLTHSILQLKGEYLIAGKQMALPFWVCSTRTKKKKKITGLQPYSHRLRSCQIPSAREIWIWWLVSNGIFQGQKKKNKTNTHFLFFVPV